MMTKDTCCFFLFSFLFLFFDPATALAQTEKIINGGFETGALEPWQYLGLAPEPPPGFITDANSYTGTYSLQMGGYTACIVEQKFPRPVLPSGNFSFMVFVPADIDPCDINIGEYCALDFGVSLQYEGDITDSYDLAGLLTGGPVWKQIDIPVFSSERIQTITFTTAEINPLYIDDVSLMGTVQFPWTLYLPTFLERKQ